MNLKPILQGLFGMALALAVYAADKAVRPATIEFQLRLPIAESLSPDLQLSFWRTHSASGAMLASAITNTDAQFRVFQKSFRLDIGDPAKGLVVYRNRGSNDQVFLLWIPINTKSGDWSNWRYPNYAETNANSNLQFNYVPPERTMNIPPNSFQLRYRLVD